MVNFKGLFKLLSLPTHGLIYASHKTKTIYRSTNQKLNTIILLVLTLHILIKIEKNLL